MTSFLFFLLSFAPSLRPSDWRNRSAWPRRLRPEPASGQWVPVPPDTRDASDQGSLAPAQGILGTGQAELVSVQVRARHVLSPRSCTVVRSWPIAGAPQGAGGARAGAGAGTGAGAVTAPAADRAAHTSLSGWVGFGIGFRRWTRWSALAGAGHGRDRDAGLGGVHLTGWAGTRERASRPRGRGQRHAEEARGRPVTGVSRETQPTRPPHFTSAVGRGTPVVRPARGRTTGRACRPDLPRCLPRPTCARRRSESQSGVHLHPAFLPQPYSRLARSAGLRPLSTITRADRPSAPAASRVARPLQARAALISTHRQPSAPARSGHDAANRALSPAPPRFNRFGRLPIPYP